MTAGREMAAGLHSFVFDLMEPQRPVVDRAILKLVDQEAFSGGDFVLQTNGVCRLNPELARRIAQEVDLQLREAA
jgi:CRISPR-associated protein Cas1